MAEVAGVSVAAAVVVLRYGGLLVGPAAVVVAVLGVAFLPRPRGVADRVVLAFAVVFGWLPLVGWIPGIGTALDVPGITLAAVAGFAVGGQVGLRRAGAATGARLSISESVALLVGVATALWWGVPQAGLALSGRLQYLTNAYDNVTHFAMFRANVALGSFEAVRRHLPGGELRLGSDYPQGIHQAWAQLVRLWAPHPATGAASLLGSYVTVLVVTNGLCVVLGCMAAARICGKDVLSALVAMGAVVALFTFGLFGPFNGYPNFDLALMAVAVAVALALRPMPTPGGQFAAVAGLGLVAAYNWYPLLVMVLPGLVVSAVELWRTSRPAGRQGAGGLGRGVVAMSALAFAGPLALFLHRGPSTLNTAGGVIAVPWGLLVVTGAGLGALVVHRQSVEPGRATALALGAPAYLGVGLLGVVLVYEVLSRGAVSYYGQKLGAGVFAVCLLVLASVVAERLSRSGGRRRTARPVVVIVSLLAAVVALEVDGYVGPDPHALGAGDVAAGVVSHDSLVAQPKTSVGAGMLLSAARRARDSGTSGSGRANGRWWYVNPGFGAYGFVYGEDGVWFSVLRGDPTQSEYEKITLQVAPHLVHAGSVDAVAAVIDRHFDPTSGRVHMFVPSWLEAALVHRRAAWTRPGVLVTIPPPSG